MFLRPRGLLANPTPTLTAPVLFAAPQFASSADTQNGLHFVWSASGSASFQISQKRTRKVHRHFSYARRTRIFALLQCSGVPFVICPDLPREVRCTRTCGNHSFPKREKVIVPARFKVFSHRGALWNAAAKGLQFFQRLRNLCSPERQRVFDLLESLSIHRYHPTYTHPQCGPVGASFTGQQQHREVSFSS